MNSPQTVPSLLTATPRSDQSNHPAPESKSNGAKHEGHTGQTATDPTPKSQSWHWWTADLPAHITSVGTCNGCWWIVQRQDGTRRLFVQVLDVGYEIATCSALEIKRGAAQPTPISGSDPDLSAIVQLIRREERLRSQEDRKRAIESAVYW